MSVPNTFPANNPFADEARAWENLAEAIVVAACKDYRKAYRRHLVRPNDETATTLNYMRRFFRSDWFNVLTSLDGEVILARLEDEVKSKVKKVNVMRVKE